MISCKVIMFNVRGLKDSQKVISDLINNMKHKTVLDAKQV